MRHKEKNDAKDKTLITISIVHSAVRNTVNYN
jgi:hypothetical protein